MSIVKKETADLFDTETGKHAGFIDLFGREQLVSLYSTQAEGAGAHYNNTPAQNTAAINAALQRRGIVSLTTPGQYLIGGGGQTGLRIPSNTTFFRGEGVEIIAADETYDAVISNESAWLPPITLSTAIAYAVGNPTEQCRIDHPGIHLLPEYQVGKWFVIAGLDPTSSSNREYMGVWQVTAIDTDKLFFMMGRQPPSGGNSQTGALIYPADHNIRVMGGLDDGNESGNEGAYPDGHLKGIVCAIRNAAYVTVRNVTYRQGPCWCVGSNNVRNYLVSDITADTFGNGVIAAHDTVHLAGGHRNVRVRRINGTCDDNMVGVTLDVMGAPGGVTYDYYNPGDVYNLRITEIHAERNVATIVALWGNTNYRHRDVVIEGVTGNSVGGAVQMLTYGFTNMLNCSGGTLRIRDVQGNFRGTPVTLRGDGAWDRIDIDGIRNEHTVWTPSVKVDRSAATQTIKELHISNCEHVVPGAAGLRSQPVVDLVNSNIKYLHIDSIGGADAVALAANTSLIRHSGTLGVIDRMLVQNVRGVSGASGDSFVVSCENENAGAIGQLTVRDSHMTGTSGTGGLVRQSPNGKVTKIIVDPTCSQTGGEGLVVRDGSGAALHTIGATVT